jgi:MYXO-CTERM domain-containing protein
MARSLSTIWGLFLTLVIVFAAGDASAEVASCDAPQVLVVLDHSSSMGERAPLDDGTLKWDAAVTAITELTSGFESTIDFGLSIFPSDGECTTGDVAVGIARNNAAAIAAALPSDVPYAGNWTPMADALFAAADYAPLQEADRRSFVALITDGWEWCAPHDPTTRFNPVTAAELLTARGITTFVIGFGSSVDTLTLNRMARASGTALPGCDATSDDYTRPDNCYFQVDDLDELRDSLDEIALHVTEEICDGLDNDCDGEIDNDAVDASTWYLDADGDGYGDPSSPIVACEPPDGYVADSTDCDDTRADVNPGAPEVCDGVDNCCDGVVDPGCACVDGDVRSCGTDEGVCSFGEQLCEDGVWGDCTGGLDPMDELCDGLDNDCDGIIDDGAECDPGFSCEDGACVADDPCADVTCGDDEVCVDGTCVGTDQPPVPDDGPTNDGCACSVSSPSTQDALPFAIAALFLLAFRRLGARRAR